MNQPDTSLACCCLASMVALVELLSALTLLLGFKGLHWTFESRRYRSGVVLSRSVWAICLSGDIKVPRVNKSEERWQSKHGT